MAKQWTVTVVWPRVPLVHLARTSWNLATHRPPVARRGFAFCGLLGPVWDMAKNTYRQLDRRGKVCSRCKESRQKRRRRGS